MVAHKRTKYQILNNLNTVIIDIKKIYPPYNYSHELLNAIKPNDSKWWNIDNQASKYRQQINDNTLINKKLSTEDKLQYVQNKQHHEPYLKLHSHNKLYQRYKNLRKQLINLTNNNVSKTSNDFKCNNKLNETF